jgi:beta-aspartyl-peptidase (threonine type)
MRPVHGDEDHEERARQGLRSALEAGSVVLSRGGSAIDAVEASVRVLEDDPCFNAGRGSTLNAEGLVELDAAIMDGADRRAGAVAGVRTTRAPISLARTLMERGPHVFLSFDGADRLAREAGLDQVENSWFVTAERRRQLDELLATGGFD